MRAIFQHELRGAFHGLAAYLFCAFLLVFVGVGAMIYNIQAAVANFEYVLQFVCIGLVVIVPVLTMRSFAEERRQKTDQLLYSLPLGTWDIVAGKYLALVTVFLVPMVFISAYPLLFSLYGEVYLPSAYGSLLAFLLLGAALIAAGIFVSSLTESQGFAAGIAIAAFLLNYYSVSLAEQVSATALGSLLALGVTALLLALLIRALTRNARPRLGRGRRLRPGGPGGLSHRRREAGGTAADADGEAFPLRALLSLCERDLRLDQRGVLRLRHRLFPVPHRDVPGEEEV